jgi:hypothetical protein
MKKLILIGLCALFVVAMAKAEDIPEGPRSSYEGLEESTQVFNMPTSAEISFTDPHGGIHTIDSKGGGVYTIHYKVPIFNGAYILYVTEEGNPFDPNTDDITLTNIIARSLQPDHDPNEIPEQTGFAPSDPEIVPLSGGDQTGGWYEGFSGTIYYADVCATTLADLESVLPDYDISKFTGDSNSIVYVQQAVVPANDFTPFVFTFEYKGYVQNGDPYWVAPNDANFTYLHSWDANIIQWNPAVAQVTDFDVQAPHIYPGSIEVRAPDDWFEEDEPQPVLILGRAGWETNPGNEIIQTGPIFGFKMYAKTPYVERGVVWITNQGVTVSPVIETSVPTREILCGDLGYPAGDINKDCKVDLTDLAYMARDWMECSDPCGTGCINANIVGVGFAFNGNDANGPARILFLYDDLNKDVLEPNDIILEYRGTAVSTGKELLDTILGMEDVNPGESILMKIKRGEVQEEVEAWTKAIRTEYSTGTKYSRCVYHFSVKDGGDFCSCEADLNTDWCEQGVNIASWGLSGRVGYLDTWCRDSNGNTYGVPRMQAAPDVVRRIIFGK